MSASPRLAADAAADAGGTQRTALTTKQDPLMRAILTRELGGPEKLTLADIPMPEPGPDQVRVAVHAAGLNFADVLQIKGGYQVKPPLPFTPGIELAGVVDALGPGVTGIKLGDRVMGALSWGAFAEHALLATKDAFPMAPAMDFVTGAAFPVAYGTAYGGLKIRGRLAEGEVLLVHGAAGGVGLTAVEVGKQMGATVIACAGSDEKLALAKRYGAAHVINYSREDIREKVKAFTGGRGADVVFDPVGGDAFDASLRCINFEGRIVIIGFASGRIPQIPANILLVKNVDAVGFVWGRYREEKPEVVQGGIRELTAMYARGGLKPHVSHVLPLEEAAAALGLMIARKSTGKVVLKIR